MSMNFKFDEKNIREKLKSFYNFCSINKLIFKFDLKKNSFYNY